MGLREFFNKKKTYDVNGFDAEGYNRLGYDRMGYDREGYDFNGYSREGYNKRGIYKLTGRDKDGYDEEGYNEEGYNREGYNKTGFDKDGYDQEGYNKTGFDKDGYDRKGYNAKGYDRNGYDKEGYDKEGYNIEGYNQEGYNKTGFDKDGYDRKGYNKAGYDREGYNKTGFDKDGYDRKGYNANGYDRNGYDKEGYNKAGYDREGYNKTGFDKDGYNRKGFNSKGYDRNGYDKEGYNKAGYDREGYNQEGYNKAGYDKEGYNIKGFNKDGVSKLGFRKEEFDKDGYHKITGLDVWGYSRYGYNINGINKYTGRDRLGFDLEGLDENGFNIWGFNFDTEKDIHGKSIDSYEDNPNMSEEKCQKFEDIYYQYMGGKLSVAIELANCYVYGNGTVKDYKKTLRILLDAAIEFNNLEAIRKLADHFFIGDIAGKNIALSKYFNDMYDNKKLESINQYKVRQALEFKKPVNMKEKILKEEEHLKDVIDCLNEDIKRKSASIKKIDDDTSWMDYDQLDDWREKKARNREAKENIEEMMMIRERPYYARMDAKTSNGQETFYIGEKSYENWENISCRILSAWSEVGRKYRDSSKTQFTINSHKYDIKLKRKLDISYGSLDGYYDEYVEGSEAAKADITDPFLLKILEEKRGEKNITNIIRSIQLNQNEIIEADFDANIIVQGCAGSGKTMILLHRLANMKYNRKKYDWSKVKIITPNKDFTLFIDELSRNLEINEIEKMTLQDYYLSILQKYDRQYPERIIKNENSSLVNYFKEDKERENLRDETELGTSILKKIYSDEFRDKLTIIAEKNREKIKCYKDAVGVFTNQVSAIMSDFGLKILKNMPNYNCILYARVLFMYLVFGAIRSNENMLCIDEGQDICEQQYLLLYEINGKKTCLNIYGDLAQRIPENVSISSWNSVEKLLNASYYELNENYRNSENIIQFYGNSLKINNKSFGLKTKDVEQFDKEILDILLKIQLLLGNRTVVISNSEKNVPPNVLNLCKTGKISKNRISVMNIKQVKGLEFDTAFVFDDGMDKNEKYIAYTRALSELYVFSNANKNRAKALNIKNELEEV